MEAPWYDDYHPFFLEPFELYFWNSLTRKSMTSSTNIYEYAKQGLMLAADRPAIWFYGKSLTYRKLFIYIDNVADHLAALGVGRGTVVTIHLPNCPQAVMAIYAVAKLGGICDMVHPLLPAVPLQKHMEFTESSVLVSGEHLFEPELIHDRKLIWVDISVHMGIVERIAYRLKNQCHRPRNAIPFESFEEDMKQKSCIHNSVSAEFPALYLQSSGTTGKAKVVVHSHRSVNNWAEAVGGYFAGIDTSKQICLSAVPLFHGIGFAQDMHWIMSRGGQQILMARWDSAMATQLIARHRVTTMAGVPAMYRSLIKEPSFTSRIAATLQECFVGGEHADERLKEEFDSYFDGQPHLMEAYGMTEILVALSVTNCHHYLRDATGQPLPGRIAAVLEEQIGEATLVGTGELLACSDSLMLGYLKDPAATKDALLNWEGKTWLRTGDLGAVTAEQYVYFTGRKKSIIIHNGYNVIPTEVEDVIRSEPSVQEVAVLGVWDEEQRTQQITAFIVLENKEKLKNVQDTILARCRRELPRYAIPRVLHVVSELPRNQMGKIDIRRLEELL